MKLKSLPPPSSQCRSIQHTDVFYSPFSPPSSRYRTLRIDSRDKGERSEYVSVGVCVGVYVLRGHGPVLGPAQRLFEGERQCSQEYFPPVTREVQLPWTVPVVAFGLKNFTSEHGISYP